MKTLNTIVAITILSLLFFSCSKDDDMAINPEQNPLPGFLEQTGFNQKEVLRIDNPNFLETGLAFIPLVDGKITAVVVKLPVKKDVRVTIWDKAEESVLWTEKIEVMNANTEIKKAISPLNLTKGKEYIISFSVTDCFRRRNTAVSAVTYPFTIGDIKITSFNYKGGASQTMPTNTDSYEYIGDCSFIFQK